MEHKPNLLCRKKFRSRWPSDHDLPEVILVSIAAKKPIISIGGPQKTKVGFINSIYRHEYLKEGRRPHSKIKGEWGSVLYTCNKDVTCVGERKCTCLLVNDTSHSSFDSLAFLAPPVVIQATEPESRRSLNATPWTKQAERSAATWLPRWHRPNS